MGCFSWICDICGNSIKSDSFQGEPCRLTLLKEGEVVQVMEGPYNSYGQVFNEDRSAVQWDMDWGDVCDLIFSDDISSGIAAAHTRCIEHQGDYEPTVQSEDDPDQGWGKDYKYIDGESDCGMR